MLSKKLVNTLLNWICLWK